MLAKRLAGVHVGEVNLNNRDVNSGQGIPDCDTRVRVSRRVDDNAMRPVNVIPNEGDNFTFGICLKDFEINTPSRSDFEQV